MHRFSGFRFVPLSSVFLVFLGNLALEIPLTAQQTPSPGTNTAAAFLAQVALKYPGVALAQSLTVSATATWTVGSQKESGSAQLTAQADGSSTLQLSLDKASRTESRSLLGATRTCQWIDSAGTHTLNDVDCNVPLAWFAPSFAIQPLSTVAQLLSISDDGQVTRDTGVLRQVSYQTYLQGTTPAITDLLTGGTHISVLFDSQTLLPNSVEYLQHADMDLNTTFPVRIVYSNYQPVAGIPLPYQIDRYVNGVLQLSLTVTSASFK